MKLSNKTILFLILLVAASLRFFNYNEIPFTHDEFSALFRLNFNSFLELIEKGVKIDGHPAGIQVFLYYWTKLFGKSEWIVKLPFTIFGIFSVYLIYVIAKKWFNESVGLISSAFLASIQYTVMYSQIARPYISGLFFSLLMVLFWTKIMLTPGKDFYKNTIIFIISASLCTYNHHFSLLFAAIVGISGLFFIKKQYLIKYIISGVIIFILYFPHLNIFLYQLNIGGVEDWLGKPHIDFIINYIAYVFNFSILSLVLVIMLILFGIYKKGSEDFDYKSFILFGCWFLLPIIIGFFYSKFDKSVLQYSVLIFSIPFLFFILFGHIKPQKTIPNLIIVCIIFIVNIFSLIHERQHYKLFYHSPYKEILIDYQKAKQNNDNILAIIDSHEKISRYYLSKLKIDSGFIWLNFFKSEKDFIGFIEHQSKFHNKLFLGCLASINPLTIPIIEDYYPVILKQQNYAGATTYLFSNEDQNENNIITVLNFESNDNKSWSSIDTAKYNDSISFSGNKSYYFDNTTEWGPVYTEKLDRIITNENNFIDISLKAKALDNLDEVILVATLESNGDNIYWGGTSFDKFVLSNSNNDNWVTIHHSIKLSDIYLNYCNILLKVYVWNKGKKSFFIDDFKIKLRMGNPVIYGLYEKIK